MVRPFRRVATLAAALALAAPALAAEPGVTPTEIVIGGDHPYSGPASAYGNVGKGIAAYFAYVNDHGGVNGRKITYIDKDDGYSPPQAVQVVHQLVDQNHVFLMFNPLGTQVNTALRPYLNENKIPQLFVMTGATTWGRDYAQWPWTIGWIPNYQAESIIYAQDIIKNHPAAKIGVIYQNDDYGLDYLAGLNKGLGAHKPMIVKAVSYETTDAGVASQIATLKASGADTFVVLATPKFAIQSLVAAAQQGWHPLIYLNNVSASPTVLEAAEKGGGPSATAGIISTTYLKDPADHARWDGDPGMKTYREIMAKYAPGGDTDDAFYVAGMAAAYGFVDCLRRAGKDPTRAKVMDAALHLDESDNPFLYPGVTARTSPTYHFPISALVFERWEGGRWHTYGNVVDARPLVEAAER